MKRWMIVSPEYGEVTPVLDYGQGPMEYGCDVVFVEAETKADARVLGIKLFRETHAHYLDDAVNPFEGIKVEEVEDCHHGSPMWRGDHYECPLCEAESIREAT